MHEGRDILYLWETKSDQEENKFKDLIMIMKIISSQECWLLGRRNKKLDSEQMKKTET